MEPSDIVIVAGARTPFVRYIGAFKDVTAIELGAAEGIAMIVEGIA